MAKDNATLVRELETLSAELKETARELRQIAEALVKALREIEELKSVPDES
jgi:uncharacterized coiled-coil DUF342 family protein